MTSCCRASARHAGRCLVFTVQGHEEETAKPSPVKMFSRQWLCRMRCRPEAPGCEMPGVLGHADGSDRKSKQRLRVQHRSSCIARPWCCRPLSYEPRTESALQFELAQLSDGVTNTQPKMARTGDAARGHQRTSLGSQLLQPIDGLPAEPFRAAGLTGARQLPQLVEQGKRQTAVGQGDVHQSSDPPRAKSLQVSVAVHTMPRPEQNRSTLTSARLMG